MCKTSTVPSIGPWYWLYLRPFWRLVAHPVNSEADNLDHPEFWRRLCVEIIAPHYSIKTPKKLEVLAQLCYAMPRGRCSKTLLRRGSGAQSFILCYGRDFPTGVTEESAKKALLKYFGLMAADRRGIVKMAFDEHERMLVDDCARIQEIIGAVPY